MPTREVLSPAQRASLLTIPADFSERELARYYTLTEEDLAIIQRRRRPENKLGFAWNRQLKTNLEQLRALPKKGREDAPA